MYIFLFCLLIHLFIVYYIIFSFLLVFLFYNCNAILFASSFFWYLFLILRNSFSDSCFQESRARLLSSVCLLNNNYDSPGRASNSSPSPGSVSPKNRRSSLPAGPTSSNYGGGPQAATPLRAHGSIHETTEAKKERRER